MSLICSFASFFAAAVRLSLNAVALCLIDAERRQRFPLIVAWGGRATWTVLAIECGATSIALDIHLEDGGVMDEAIDGGERHSLVTERRGIVQSATGSYLISR